MTLLNDISLLLQSEPKLLRTLFVVKLDDENADRPDEVLLHLAARLQRWDCNMKLNCPDGNET